MHHDDMDNNLRLLSYNNLVLLTIRHIKRYIEENGHNLEAVKPLFEDIIPTDDLERIESVEDLLQVLKQHGLLSQDNVSIIRRLAEELEIRKLLEKIESFELEHEGKC
jgi:hypothetical protein